MAVAKLPKLGKLTLTDIIEGSPELRYAARRILEEIATGECRSIARVVIGNPYETAYARIQDDYIDFAQITLNGPNKPVIADCFPDAVPMEVGEFFESIRKEICDYNPDGYLQLNTRGREILERLK